MAQKTLFEEAISGKSKVIGIVGSRRRDSQGDFLLCERAFSHIYKAGDRIVSGGCPEGGDRFAEEISRRYGCQITIHRPDWKLGKFAGFLRNTDIARDCTILIAVVADDRTGSTEDTVKKVQKLGKQVIYV